MRLSGQEDGLKEGPKAGKAYGNWNTEGEVAWGIHSARDWSRPIRTLRPRVPGLPSKAGLLALPTGFIIPRFLSTEDVLQNTTQARRIDC